MKLHFLSLKLKTFLFCKIMMACNSTISPDSGKLPETMPSCATSVKNSLYSLDTEHYGCAAALAFSTICWVIKNGQILQPC